MFRKKSILLMMLSVTLFLLVACVSQPPEDTSSGQNIEDASSDEISENALVIAYDRDAETLDHIMTSDYHNASVYLFDRLVVRDDEFNYHPSLAEKWEVSEDGLTWTFYLKKNVKFHDGTEMTAQDRKSVV